MECDICSQDLTAVDGVLCVGCARSSIYLSRLETARILLEKEKLGAQVEAIVQPSAKNTIASKENSDAQDLWRAEAAIAARIVKRGRVEEIQSQIGCLKEDIAKMKDEILQRKAELALRRKTLEAIDQTVPSRQKSSLAALTEVKEKGIIAYHNANHRATNTRAFLCRETANLLGLKQKKRMRNGEIREQYSITGMILPDLRDINNMRCADLTAALTSAAHLITLVSFYLGIRLPAEVTAAHRDYPLPTINTPANSYLGQKTAFPGSGSINTAPSSPFSSKQDIKVPYRPRPLFIGSDDKEERVAQFAKKDSSAFNLFIEGISLIAWDVAWLSRSQGFSSGTTSWEDICQIGRNIHQLILSPPQSPAILRVLSSREAQKRQKPASTTSAVSPVSAESANSLGRLGQTSHLSSHSYLGSAAANEQLRNWKYSKWNAISVSLHRHLQTEMNNAEWEVLQEQEWDDGGEQFDEAVFVKGRNSEDQRDDIRSTIATTHVESEPLEQSEDGGSGKTRGTSGWTKLRGRDKDRR